MAFSIFSDFASSPAGRRTHRRAVSLRPIAATLLAALALCGPSRAQELRLATSRGPVSLPVYVAQAEGHFTREGVAVRLLECTSGRQCVQLLGQGQADIATAAELMVTLGALDGLPNVILATISTSTHHIKLVARRDAGIESASDLRGKRIATAAGTSAQYFLDNWLVYNDIDPQSVSLVTMRPDELQPSLLARKVDAIAIWEPIASAAARALGPQGAVLPSPRVYTQHFSLIAGRETVRSREADLIKLLRALERAQRFIAEKPLQALRILLTQLPAEAGAVNLAEHEFKLSLDQPLVATMEGQARWARQQGLVRSHAPANLLQNIEPSLLRRAVPGSVTLVY